MFDGALGGSEDTEQTILLDIFEPRLESCLNMCHGRCVATKGTIVEAL